MKIKIKITKLNKGYETMNICINYIENNYSDTIIAIANK